MRTPAFLYYRTVMLKQWSVAILKYKRGQARHSNLLCWIYES